MAARSDSNRQHSVLETDALPIGATSLAPKLDILKLVLNNKLVNK